MPGATVTDRGTLRFVNADHQHIATHAAATLTSSMWYAAVSTACLSFALYRLGMAATVAMTAADSSSHSSTSFTCA